MKINMPINQTEYRVDPKQPIVTRTDLKGVITYANPAFVALSGFSEKEVTIPRQSRGPSWCEPLKAAERGR